MDTNYIFFAVFTELHMASSTMSIQLRKGKPMTRDVCRIRTRVLQNKHEVEKCVLNKDATKFMQPLQRWDGQWWQQPYLLKVNRQIFLSWIRPQNVKYYKATQTWRGIGKAYWWGVRYIFRVEYQARGSPYIHLFSMGERCTIIWGWLWPGSRTQTDTDRGTDSQQKSLHPVGKAANTDSEFANSPWQRRW